MPAPVRLRQLLVVPLLALALAVGCSLIGPVSSASASTRNDRVLRAANIALQQVGDPYRYGATGPKAVDCSGLFKYSFGRAGISIPRTSSGQARSSHRIAKSKLRRGDLMFFTDGGGVYHVAMFLRWRDGHAVMLHSPRPGQRVKVDRPWTSRWFAGTFRH